MNATEAKDLALRINIAATNSQYKTIMNSIAEAAFKGEYHVFVYEPIKADVKKKLVEEGYKVDDQTNSREGPLISIEWN